MRISLDEEAPMTRLSTYPDEQRTRLCAEQTGSGGDARRQAHPTPPDEKPRGEPAKPTDKPLPDLPNPTEVGEDG
jgi:hypothetical protein